MEFGQTYYCRLDEVNGAPDFTVYKGDVWGFTVEPLALPIANVLATATSANADTMGPENMVNGSGLNELDQHAILPDDMWLSGVGDPQPAIQYAFHRAHKLHELWVWNSNQMIESFIGLRAREVTVETSMDGDTWTVLEGTRLVVETTQVSP